jgi:hypothetical protein
VTADGASASRLPADRGSSIQPPAVRQRRGCKGVSLDGVLLGAAFPTGAQMRLFRGMGNTTYASCVQPLPASICQGPALTRMGCME